MWVACKRSSARDRWRMAISRVIQGRAKRSRWQSVLLTAKRHRVDLMFDLLGELPVFADTSKAQTLTLCASATLQTYEPDSLVFARGDAVADRCFLILAGEVIIQQALPGGAYAAAIASSSAHSLGSPAFDGGAPKVVVHIAKAGDIFGDFELLADVADRQLIAATANSVTKLAILPREDFLHHWPRRIHLELKLTAIKNAFSGVLKLDSDHLSSLFYAAQEKTFKRGEGGSLFLPDTLSCCKSKGLITLSCC